MSNRSDVEIRALSELGREFRRLATAEPLAEVSQRPARANRARMALALAALLAVTGLSLTPPGRALAERIGELVGIGEPATLPPEEHSSFTERGQAIVIASGRAPDGTPYEVVANRSVENPGPIAVPAGKDPDEYRATHHEGGPVTCVTVDLPEAPKAGTVEFCVGAGDQGLLGKTGVMDGVNFLDRRADLAEDDPSRPEARYLITAELSPDITDVEATYENEAGSRVEAYSDVGQVDAEIADLIGTDDRIGWMVAFLPDDGLPPYATPHGPGHRPDAGVLGTLQLAGIDDSGVVVARDDFGTRFARELEEQNRRLEAERTIRLRVLSALEAKNLDVPLCLEAIRARVTGRARDACLDVLRKAPNLEVR